MAFCIYCGKKLEEGETCDCQNIQTGQETENIRAGGNAEETFNQAKEASGAYLKKLFGAFISVLKKPVAYGKELVVSGDAKLGVGFYMLQAILSALFVLIVCGKINKLAKAAVSNSDAQNLFSYPKAFLLTAAGSLVMSFAFAGLLYLGAMLLKGKTTFGEIVCITAVRSAGVSIFLIISIVVVFLNVAWGFIFFVLSWLTGLVFMIPVMQRTAGLDANRLPYMFIIAAILSIVVFYICMKIGLPMYLPSELKEEFKDALDGIQNLWTLSSMF